ncbi:hypothetical protein SLA2020_023980 [Shorea laevis]
MNGCKQDVVSQECDGGQDADLFYFQDMPNTDWPDSDYEYFQPVTEDWCRLVCLTDCFRVVAIFRNSNCWFKKIPLSNRLFDSSVGGKALVKMRKNNPTNTLAGEGSNKKPQSTEILIGTLILSSSAF